ncbi:DUF3263 domain-containing protein, partial [Rhodococcus koreensis]|uniref:DUF3263 domain-containing protein n=1 Tax=Rhodococcus koreensis TaxID=99653 RepID=UPI00366B1F2C
PFILARAASLRGVIAVGSMSVMRALALRSRRRQRRRPGPPARMSTGNPEAYAIVDLARVWAPYGGASDEEIMIRFGMTRTRFYERLGSALSEISIHPVLARQLADAYPDVTTNGSQSDSTPGAALPHSARRRE